MLVDGDGMSENDSTRPTTPLVGLGGRRGRGGSRGRCRGRGRGGRGRGRASRLAASAALLASETPDDASLCTTPKLLESADEKEVAAEGCTGGMGGKKGQEEVASSARSQTDVDAEKDGEKEIKDAMKLKQEVADAGDGELHSPTASDAKNATRVIPKIEEPLEASPQTRLRVALGSTSKPDSLSPSKTDTSPKSKLFFLIETCMLLISLLHFVIFNFLFVCN